MKASMVCDKRRKNLVIFNIKKTNERRLYSIRKID